MNKLSGLMLAEGAGGELLRTDRVDLGSGATSRIEFVKLGGGIAGTDRVVAGTEGARSSLVGFETGLTDRSLAGVLAANPLGTFLEYPRVMRVYSASIPSLSYEIRMGRLLLEYFAVMCFRIVSAWLMMALKSLTTIPM
jgi:hypothetical protein